MSDEYQCAACGGTFGKVRSDEQAMAEAQARHPGVPPDGMVVVCDDCFREMGIDEMGGRL